jgi:hypothetical protein
MRDCRRFSALGSQFSEAIEQIQFERQISGLKGLGAISQIGLKGLGAIHESV